MRLTKEAVDAVKVLNDYFVSQHDRGTTLKIGKAGLRKLAFLHAVLNELWFVNVEMGPR